MDDWQEGDDAWEEHQRTSRMCPLVRLDLHASRELTFELGRWRHKHIFSISAAQMAAAGFYYWPLNPQDDTAMCFQCDLALDGWEPTDNPRYK